MNTSSRTYRIAAYLSIRAWLGVLVGLFCGLGFFSFWLHGHLTSPDVPLYQANAEAAADFVQTVKSEWFYNRPLVLEKLERMTLTYHATGEGNAAKLGELARLKDWTVAAVSVADQQQYLSEVRSHGAVTAMEPFFNVWSVGILLSLIFTILGFLTVYWVYLRCKKLSGFQSYQSSWI